ncbi:MAG: DUF1906 domain-containing protein [Chloroflexi bacterium]|nr:MAG: DUF1906 domain-containing protein [Chloroflexota bacterium]
MGPRRTGVPVHLLRHLLSNLNSRPKAHLAVVFIAVSNHLTVVALAASPAVLSMPSLHPTQSACGPDSSCDALAGSASPNLSLPAGASQCHDSGPAAACSFGADAKASSAGTTSLPAGQGACAAVASKPVPSTPAACGNALLTPDAPARSSGVSAGPAIAPSVPVDSLGARLPDELTLTSDTEAVRAGKPALLTATTNATVTGTDRAIEIFDQTSGTLVAACAQGSQCSVGYAATSGVHEFAAFVTPPTTTAPNNAVALPSNHVSVGWLDSAIAANRTVVGPGQAITVTATSTFDVQKSGRWLEIYDLSAGARVTYCSRGTVCTTTMKQTTGGVHQIVGYITGKPEAVSMPVNVTWLRVSLAATSIGPKSGGTVNLRATANADLSGTPWVLGIYDQNGNLVDHVCKSATCTVQAWMDGSSNPAYTAVIGALPQGKPGLIERITHAVGAPTPQPLVDIQTRSTPVEPTHLLWGVDSCKAFTGDSTGELFYAVAKKLGTPDFWGRYLTDTVCPGISSNEVSMAARYHLGILPIYNDYNCSDVRYYETGHAYAVAAVAAAKRLGIPAGRVIAIDIEPPGDACPGAANVDSGFIEGWFDGIHDAGYVPTYYGNGTSGTEFASAWCATVSKYPNIATDSDLWSFQPSLLGSFSKVWNPGYGPYDTGCAGNMLAWQYVLSAGAVVDVDQDEAISSLPLWYPS